MRPSNNVENKTHQILQAHKTNIETAKDSKICLKSIFIMTETRDLFICKKAEVYDYLGKKGSKGFQLIMN